MPFKMPSRAELSESFVDALKKKPGKEQALTDNGWVKSENGKNWQKDEFELPTDAAYKMHKDMKVSKRPANPI